MNEIRSLNALINIKEYQLPESACEAKPFGNSIILTKVFDHRFDHPSKKTV